MDAQTAAADDLRGVGLRVTAQRVAVLEQLRGGGHHTASEVVAGVKARLGAVSPQAVYDTVRALTEAGLAVRLEPGTGAARFESAGPPHHHLVCRRCGAVADVGLARTIDLEPDDPQGFEVDHAELTFRGTCPRCLAEGRAPPEATPS